MRIHLPLHPRHFSAGGPSTTTTTSPSLALLGGELVLIELQGELTHEGDKTDGVVGVLGLDRPDKPTLHLGEHHLLHGKFANLQKPYAVIRKATGETGGTALEGDASEEEEVGMGDQGEGVGSAKKRKTHMKGQHQQQHGSSKPRQDADEDDEEEDEDEPPLFAPDPDIFPSTPSHAAHPPSSSPFLPPSAARDYSSELDPASSPARWTEDEDEEARDRLGDKEERIKRERAREKRKRDERERTRHYEVVGIVRKKVVFALRPEPIVTATILPD